VQGKGEGTVTSQTWYYFALPEVTPSTAALSHRTPPSTETFHYMGSAQLHDETNQKPMRLAANSYKATYEISCNLLNPQVGCGVHNSLQLVPILRQIHCVHPLPSLFLRMKKKPAFASQHRIQTIALWYTDFDLNTRFKKKSTKTKLLHCWLVLSFILTKLHSAAKKR